MKQKSSSQNADSVVLERDRLVLQEALRHHQNGDLVRAEVGYRNVLQSQKDNFDAMHMLAVVGYQTNQMAGSLELFERAKAIGPTTCEFFVNYGAALRKAKRLPEAVAAYDEALKLQPNKYEALVNKAESCLDLKELETAATLYERAITIRPNEAEAWLGLGAASAARGDWKFRVNCFERALSLNPKSILGIIALANLYKDRDWLWSAEVLLDKALAIEPRHPTARIHRSVTLLRAGRLAEGWPDYDGRFWYLDERVPKLPVPPVYWDGEPLDGKSIKIWPEQGVGDALLYSTMVPELIARASRVTLHCDPRLIPVFVRSFPTMTVLPRQDSIDPLVRNESHDYQAALGSIGRFLRPSFDTFPKTAGYLQADNNKVKEFKLRYGDKKLIGLSWRSKAERIGEAKSCSLEAWIPFLKNKEVTFVNLQYGDTSEEISALKAKYGIEIINDPIVDPLTDMDSFFAQVAAMDLVISTSSTTVHVAGALGRETWTLLPRGPGALWYWFLDREDCPWYPSVRLFRQSEMGEWSDVISRVSAQLDGWLRSRAPA